MAEFVEAEVMGEAASKQDVIRFDAERLAGEVLEMARLIETAQGKAELYGNTDISECTDTQIREYLADMNGAIRSYDEARKTFKRDIMAPYSDVEQKGNAAITPLKNIVAAYKDRLDELEEIRKSNCFEGLRVAYEEYAPALAEVVPLERFLDKSWLNKTTKPAKAAQEMRDRVKAIDADWQSLKSTELNFPDETIAVFFRSLDKGAALAYDVKRKEEAERIEKLNASTEQPKVGPAVWDDGECEAIDPREIRVPVLLCAEMSDWELDALGAYLKSHKIHGRYAKAPGYESCTSLWAKIKKVLS